MTFPPDPPDEEQALTGAIDAAQLSPFRFHGWLGKRLTASYGWRYDFDTGSFGLADPIPDWLLPLREKAARFRTSDVGRVRAGPSDPASLRGATSGRITARSG